MNKYINNCSNNNVLAKLLGIVNRKLKINLKIYICSGLRALSKFFERYKCSLKPLEHVINSVFLELDARKRVR